MESRGWRVAEAGRKGEVEFVGGEEEGGAGGALVPLAGVCVRRFWRIGWGIMGEQNTSVGGQETFITLDGLYNPNPMILIFLG